MSVMEQKKLGLRIKSVRILTGLNQQEFAKACNFNHTSLRNWEFGRVLPRKEAIERLIKSFQAFSIHVDKEWLAFGKGEGPVFTEHAPKNHASNPAWRNEFLAFKETCVSIGENAIVVKIDDDEMAPHYCADDWVGAIAQSLTGLQKKSQALHILEKPLLVKTSENEFKIRHVLHDGDTWLAKSNHSYQTEKIVSDVVGIIVMHTSFRDFLHKLMSAKNEELTKSISGR